MDHNHKRVFRFAPSPTGSMHIGNARSALFNWLLARSTGSKFYLRIEDTDLARSEQRYADSIMETLSWLGLNWDNPDVMYQSKRFETYKSFARDLMAKNLAYWCECTQEKLDSDRQKAIAAEQTYKYPGTCREKKINAEFGKFALRFRTDFYDSPTISFTDAIRKSVEVESTSLDDIVIFRAEGSPTYNFCVVIDDHEMGITDVVRAEEHISNTPKQLLLYKAFGWQAPTFAHLPMVLSPTGGKLSKRDGATSVEEYRRMGFVSQAIFNYLVRLGWSHGDQEVFSIDEAIKYFSMEKIGRKGAAFDLKKLQWFNATYIKKMSTSELEKALLDCKFDIQNPENTTSAPSLAEQIEAAVGQVRSQFYELYAPRSSTLLELANSIISISKKGQYPEFELPESDLEMAGLFAEQMREQENFSAGPLQNLAAQICQSQGKPLHSLATVLRLLVTGNTSSPNIFKIMEIFGKQEVLERLLQSSK